MILFHSSSWDGPAFGFAPLSRHGFDPGVEPVVSERLILVERHAEVGNRRIIEGGAEEVSVYVVPGDVVRGKSEIEGVRGKYRIG